MTSPSYNKAFIIIRQDENGRPHQIIRHDTGEGTYLASSIDITLQALKIPAGMTALKELVEKFGHPLEVRCKDLPEDQVVTTFTDMIMEHFVIVVDHSLTNPDLRGLHWRIRGGGTDFDTRKQSIVLNGVIVDKLCRAGKSAQGIKDPNSKEQKQFRKLLFSTSATLLHEIGHVFVTFLGGGKVDTPPHIDAQLHVKTVGSTDTKGEAGAYLEYEMFGGKVIRLRDPTQDDSQPGILCLIKKDDTYRIPQKTVDGYVKCEFSFPLSTLGVKRPAGLRTMGEGLPMVKSNGNPMSKPETKEPLAERPVEPLSLEEFEKAVDDLIADNPNPKTFSSQQESVIRKVPFDPSLRIVSSA